MRAIRTLLLGAIGSIGCATTTAEPTPSSAPVEQEAATTPSPTAEEQRPEQAAPAAPAAPTDDIAKAAEAFALEVLRMGNEQNAILETIVDEESAKAAIPKLQALLQHFERVKAGAVGMRERISPADRERVGSKYDPEMREMQQRFFREVQRVKKIPGAWDVIRTLDPKRSP